MIDGRAFYLFHSSPTIHPGARKKGEKIHLRLSTKTFREYQRIKRKKPKRLKSPVTLPNQLRLRNALLVSKEIIFNLRLLRFHFLDLVIISKSVRSVRTRKYTIL